MYVEVDFIGGSEDEISIAIFVIKGGLGDSRWCVGIVCERISNDRACARRGVRVHADGLGKSD